MNRRSLFAMSENPPEEELRHGEHRAQPELLMPHTTLARIAGNLAIKYEGIVSRQTVERCVFESYAALRRTARIQAHLTTLAGRFAADRLQALAQAEGMLPKDVPEVLFICVHNAGRSQMAAGLLARHAHGRVHVRSAGSAPVGSINPTVVQAMGEIDIDLGAEFPKPLTDDVVAAADAWWSRWAAGMRARSIRANATWTGRSPTPTVDPSTRYAPSATISTHVYESCSPSSPFNLPESLAVSRERGLHACDHSECAVRVCPQRRPFPDGGRFPRRPRGRSGGGPVGRIRTR